MVWALTCCPRWRSSRGRVEGVLYFLRGRAVFNFTRTTGCCGKVSEVAATVAGVVHRFQDDHRRNFTHRYLVDITTLPESTCGFQKRESGSQAATGERKEPQIVMARMLHECMLQVHELMIATCVMMGIAGFRAYDDAHVWGTRWSCS